MPSHAPGFLTVFKFAMKTIFQLLITALFTLHAFAEDPAPKKSEKASAPEKCPICEKAAQPQMHHGIRRQDLRLQFGGVP